MSGRFGAFWLWLLVLLVTAVAFVFVFVPVWLIQPFSPQTSDALSISFFLKSWSPVLTIAAVVAVVAFAALMIRRGTRWYLTAPLILPLALVMLFAWFARQNHFLWMFSPLETSRYARVAEVAFLGDDEMVMAVNVNGEAVAYPVRWMAYHHIVQDVVGGQPITATY